MKIFQFILIIYFIFSQSVSADEPAFFSPEAGDFLLNRFRISLTGMIQDDGNSFSIEPSWNPKFALTEDSLLIGLNLGATVFHTVSNEKFLALEYQLTAEYTISSPIGIELAAGAQTWVSQSSTYPLLTGNLFYSFWDELGPAPINRVFISYSRYLLPDFFTYQIKAGIEFGF